VVTGQGTKGVDGALRWVCSYETARQLLRAPGEQTGFRARHCRDPEQAPGVVEKNSGSITTCRVHQPGTVLPLPFALAARPAAANGDGRSTTRSACWWVGDHQPILVSARRWRRCFASSPLLRAWAFRAGDCRRRRDASFWNWPWLGVALAVPVSLPPSRRRAVNVQILLEPWMPGYAPAVTLVMGALLSGLVALRSLKPGRAEALLALNELTLHQTSNIIEKSLDEQAPSLAADGRSEPLW